MILFLLFFLITPIFGFNIDPFPANGFPNIPLSLLEERAKETKATNKSITNISTNTVTNIVLNREIIITTNIFKTNTNSLVTNVSKKRNYASSDISNQSLQETMALLKAIRAGDLDLVIELLNNGISPNSRLGDNGVSALMLAVSTKNVIIIETLLSFGANPNLTTNHENIRGITPIMMAAQQGPMISIDLLIEYGADVNAQTLGQISGNSAIHAAIAAKKTLHVRNLLKNGADPNLAINGQKVKNITPLMLAVEQGNKSIMDALFDSKVDPSAEDSEGKSALVYAYVSGNYHLVRDLIEYGVTTKLSSEKIKELTEHYRKDPSK